jgi:Tfp pilus assembly protein PilF
MLILFGFIKKLRPLLIPFALFTIGLLPVLGLFPFVTQAISTVSDRYIYMAMLGPSLGVAWVLMKEKGTIFIFIPLLFIFGVKSSIQKWNWENEFVAFKNAVYVNPQSYIGHHYTGLAYLKQGKIKEADFHFSEMSRIKPSYEKSPHVVSKEPDNYGESTGKYKTIELDKKLAVDYNELGNSLMSISNFKLAVEKYKMALRIAPEMSHINNNLATALHALKRDKEALEAVYESLKNDPGFIEAYLNLAVILGDLGRYDEAEDVLKGALKIAPQDAEIHNNLGIVLVENGKIEEGLQSFREALRIDPKYEEAIQNI